MLEVLYNFVAGTVTNLLVQDEPVVYDLQTADDQGLETANPCTDVECNNGTYINYVVLLRVLMPLSF